MTTGPFALVPTLTSSAAIALIHAATSAAAALGKPLSITVLDSSARVLAVLRMDGAPIQSIQVSHDKAYTAVGYGIPSEKWMDRSSQFGENGPLIVTSAIDHMIPLAGGIPIYSGNAIAGAIGVSGATAAEDKQIAEAAIASIDSDRLK